MRLNPWHSLFRLSPWPSSATGDVAGPASATDNALVRFDGATGKIIQNSGVIVDDNNNITGIASISISKAGLGGTFVNTTDANSVQVAIFEGDRATMADQDEAYISLRLSDDAGTQTEVARITWAAPDVNVGTSVDGRLDFSVMLAGTLAKELQLSGADLSPSTDDGLSLGTINLQYSDLFLASGGVINFANDVQLTHSANVLTLAGGDLALGANNLTMTGSLAATGARVTKGWFTDVESTNAPTIGGTAASGTGGLVRTTSPQLTTSLTTDSTTFALLNATATTINFAGAATTLNIGASATCILNFGGSTTASEFRFLEPSGSGTNYSAFKAQAQAANITYTLPATVGAAGTYLTDAAGNGTLSWATVSAGGFDPQTTVEIMDDFGGSSLATAGNIGTLGWNLYGATAIEGGAMGDTSGFGAIVISSGTSNSTRQGIILDNPGGQPPIFDTGINDVTVIVRMFNSQAANAGLKMFFGLGTGNTAAGVGMQTGIYFYVGGSGNWEAVTANADTKTTTDTGIAQATTYKTFKFVVNAAGTSVVFSIDGSTVATHTTNLPAQGGRIYPFLLATPSDGVARKYEVDYYYLKMTGLAR